MTHHSDGFPKFQVLIRSPSGSHGHQARARRSSESQYGDESELIPGALDSQESAACSRASEQSVPLTTIGLDVVDSPAGSSTWRAAKRERFCSAVNDGRLLVQTLSYFRGVQRVLWQRDESLALQAMRLMDQAAS